MRALQPGDAGRVLRDGDSVIGTVLAAKDGAVSVRFSLRYKSGGRGREVRLLTRPACSLAEMRIERDKVRAEIRDGIDPAERRQEARLQVRAEIVESERRIAE